MLVPPLDKPGGVANYYNAIKGNLPIGATYFTRGTRKGTGKIAVVFDFLMDYIKFIFRVFSYDIILINTSFAKPGVTRDSIFCLLCRLFRKPYIVFFRGWDKQFEKKVSSGFFRRLFARSFLKARKIIVLSSEFGTFIKGLGFDNKIVTETTIVDKNLFKGQHIDALIQGRRDTVTKMLFLSRLEKNKGIVECLEIHKRLTQLGYKNQLLIAGAGGADNLVLDLDSPDIVRLGYVSGQKKIDAYSNAHFYLFPSTHGEGMPNSVLEAMMFGLPVLTTKVGGIKDFFDDSMGISTDKPDVEAYVTYIVKVLNNDINVKTVALRNNRYATENFSQDVVAARLLKVISE